MLILRVASGRAWNSETATRPGVSSMSFSSRSGAATTTAATSRFSAIHLDGMGKAKQSQDEESGSKGGDY